MGSLGDVLQPKANYGSLEMSARHLRTLERENNRLKKLLVKAMLDNVVLKDLASKMARPALRGLPSAMPVSITG